MTPRSCPAASTAPFGFDSTAAEVVTGVDLAAKRAIVTGGSSGIGIDTARALASAGAAVTLAVRDTVAGERTAARIAAMTGNDRVEVRRLDLADPASVGAFVASWAGPLHLLINNAGVMALPQLCSPRTAGSCTSRQTTSGISRLPSACTNHWSRPAVHGSCRSARRDATFRR